jgi:hypothetical protein
MQNESCPQDKADDDLHEIVHALARLAARRDYAQAERARQAVEKKA